MMRRRTANRKCFKCNGFDLDQGPCTCQVVDCCSACDDPYDRLNPKSADGRDRCKACAAFDDVPALDEQLADAQLAAYNGDRL